MSSVYVRQLDASDESDEFTVELDLPTPVLGGQTVRLSYLPPHGVSAAGPGWGARGAAQRTFSITNNTDVPPSLVSGNDSAVVDGDTLTLTYNKALDETSEPDIAAYTVTVDTVDRGVSQRRREWEHGDAHPRLGGRRR